MSCPACKDGTLKSFFRVESAPGNSCLLMESAEEARAYPRGTIDLGFCSRCGFISNQAIDLALTEYSGRYEETQGFSPTFRRFHEGLARELIERHDLHNKRIVEIGCGKGEFLHMLCAFGDNDGIGFDPSYVEEREQAIRGERVRFVKDYFSASHEVEQADFVACKMTLEHIPECRHFVDTIRQAIHGEPDSVVFIQVPDTTRILQECAFEDIYYEHCSYFTPVSLRYMFRDLGFDVVHSDIEYDGQYLTVEARYGNGKPSAKGDDILSRELDELRGLVDRFPQRVSEKISGWQNEVRKRAAAGQRVVLWGSGSKGVSFLTTLGLSDEIEHVVDINPNRQGNFMAGTGQRIVAPEDLQDLRPDYVIIMNRIYTEEIREMLDGLGLHPELAAL